MFTPGFRDTTSLRKDTKRATAKKSIDGTSLDLKEAMQSRYNRSVSKQIEVLRNMGVYACPGRRIEHNPDRVVRAISQIEKNGVDSWPEFVASQSGFGMSGGDLVFRHSELDPAYLDEVQVTIVAPSRPGKNEALLRTNGNQDEGTVILDTSTMDGNPHMAHFPDDSARSNESMTLISHYALLKKGYRIRIYLQGGGVLLTPNGEKIELTLRGGLWCFPLHYIRQGISFKRLPRMHTLTMAGRAAETTLLLKPGVTTIVLKI